MPGNKRTKSETDVRPVEGLRDRFFARVSTSLSGDSLRGFFTEQRQLRRTQSAPASAASASSSETPKSSTEMLLEVDEYQSPVIKNFITQCPTTDAAEKQQFIDAFILKHSRDELKNILDRLLAYRIRGAGEGVSLLRGNAVDERLALAILQHLLYTDEMIKANMLPQQNEAKETESIDIQIIKLTDDKKTPDVKALQNLLQNLPKSLKDYLQQIYNCFLNINFKKRLTTPDQSALKETTYFLLFHIILPRYIQITTEMTDKERSANIQLKKFFQEHLKSSTKETEILDEILSITAKLAAELDSSADSATTSPSYRAK